jgi:hypothetical protein
MFDNDEARPSSARRGGLTVPVSVPGRVSKALQQLTAGSGTAGAMATAGRGEAPAPDLVFEVPELLPHQVFLPPPEERQEDEHPEEHADCHVHDGADRGVEEGEPRVVHRCHP